jgi:thermitase
MVKREAASVLIIVVILTSIAYSTGIVVPQSTDNSTFNSSNLQPNTLANQGQGVEAYGAWQGFVDSNPELSIQQALGTQAFNSMASWWRINSYTAGDRVRVIIGAEGDGSLNSAKLNVVLVKYGGAIVSTISLYGRLSAIVAELPLASVSGFAKEAYSQGLIGYAEPDMKVQATYLPNDPSWNLQWGPQKIQADWAWNTTRGDHSLLVAVVDTGIAYSHPDIAPNYVALGYNWVYNNRNPMDDNGHGTHCTGIIAAVTNNSVGIAGIAQVRVMAEKVLDSGGAGYWDWVANGIINATDAGAKIISMSLGGAGDSQLVHDAIKYAYAHGVLIVAAAGNSDSNQLFYPAGYDEVISVAATDQTDSKAFFSNWGDKIELAAPGVDIYSTVPSGYESMSGTSMACPHVAGVAALAWCLFANRSRDWIRLWLRYTADDLGAPGFDPYFGYGRVDARNVVERVPPAHELILTNVEKPRYVEPGQNVVFNASVLNFGSHDENNVEVQLLVNNTIIDTATIGFLGNCSSTDVSLPWNPTIEATYNVTFYAVPVSGEVNTSDNAQINLIKVRVPAGFILIDQSHYNNPSGYYTVLETTLTDRGYIVDTLTTSPISLPTLRGYDVLVIPDSMLSYSADEVSAIELFVLTGGSILVMGDYYTSVYDGLTSFAGIDWNNTYVPFYGNTTDIVHHMVTEGVSTVYFGGTSQELLLQNPATPLIMRGNGYTNVLLAISQAGIGRVACVADSSFAEDSYIMQADNAKLCNNLIDWLSHGERYQHQLVVYLDSPRYLEPGMSSTLTATVYNVGNNNETNIELQILVNGTMAKDVTDPILANGTSYTTTFLWTPLTLGWYNLTAYAVPIIGENTTAYNAMTKLAHVMYPLIRPEAGQYTNYAVDEYSGSVITTFYFNITYDHYVQYDTVSANLVERTPDNFTYSAYSIVNIFTRNVEEGAYVGYSWPYWIETGLSNGSRVSILNTVVNVNGSEFVLYHLQPIDCWQIPLYSLEKLTYDKAHGLLMGLFFSLGSFGEDIKLLDTNVPLNTTYSHELGVTLDAPHSLLLSRSALLNATAYNLGQNNETDVVLSIVIDGTLVNSADIAILLSKTAYTMSYLWTPPQKGTYTIEARVSPVSHETDLENNNATSTTVVFFYARIYIPHEWQGGGTSTGGIGSDFGFIMYLPYPIEFCGLQFQTLWVSSNGLISFLSYDSSHNNNLTMLSPRFAIAPAWSYWVVPPSGGIYTWSDTSSIGIRWSVASYYNSSIAADFEVIIRRNGAIHFNYGQCTGNLSATVGISDGRGFMLAENMAVLNYANSIVFTDDVTPPATVTDLATKSPLGFSITLAFTAPGDDGNVGTASGYVVKYSTLGPITDANWSQATTCNRSWIPHQAGYLENLVVNNLRSKTRYWFAVVAYDDVPWFGGVSNSPSGVTADAIPPDQITDLAVIGVTSTSVTLNWTAVGDDGKMGAAASYIVKYSTAEIYQWTWNTATTYNQSWIPRSSGSIETYEVSGLQPGTTYWFVVVSVDVAGNYALISNSPSARTLGGQTTPPDTRLIILISMITAVSVAVLVGGILIIHKRRLVGVA